MLGFVPSTRSSYLIHEWKDVVPRLNYTATNARIVVKTIGKNTRISTGRRRARQLGDWGNYIINVLIAI